MNMRLRLPMALALALGTSHAHALGLGQIEVKSTLNQPLVAEIPVIISSPGEADALAVRLASPDAFARVGLDRPALQAANLQFDVQSDARGRKVIRVTTPTNVSDPFLSFLLEVDWGKGRMLREYTVLLDPPSMAPITASAPAVATAVPEPGVARAEPLLEAPPAMPVSTPTPEPAPAPQPVAAPPPQPVQVPVQESYPAYGANTYAVDTGDTLWSIAQRTRPDDSVTINQMMLALLRANPEAFVGNNINRLKRGAVLRIPGRDEATVMAAAEAAAQVRDQMQSWSGSVATMAQPADASGTAPASTRPARSTADSRLELTPPRGNGDATASQSGASADGSGRELRAELARAREESSALSQENVELKSRVSELEAIQGESRRLIELKDSELAAVQRRLAEAEAAASASGATITPASGESITATDLPAEGAVDAVADEPVSDAELAGHDVVDATDSTDAAEVVSDEAVSGEAVSEPVALADPAPAPAVDPAPVAAPSAPASASSSSFNPWIVGGGAAVLLGLVGLLLARRKKRPVADAAPMASAAAVSSVVAYDDADQEEGELIEAIAQYPADLQLHLDLVRHYFSRDDGAGFEMAAEAMYAQVYDAHDPAWQEVLTLGRQISPDHPLFATTAAVQDEISSFDDFPDIDAPLPDSNQAYASDAGTEAGTAGEREIDWFGTPASTPAPEPVLDAEPEAEVSLDFGDDDVSFESDFADAPAASDPGTDADAAATKLELARAYLDMGDAEGARGMLEEVLTEGSATQRDEARRLLDGIF